MKVDAGFITDFLVVDEARHLVGEGVEAEHALDLAEKRLVFARLLPASRADLSQCRRTERRIGEGAF